MVGLTLGWAFIFVSLSMTWLTLGKEAMKTLFKHFFLWRGYILPRLQAEYNALVSSLIVGVIWSVWHLPKFFGSGLNNNLSSFWFTVFTVSVAVLYTWLYNNTHGSLQLVTIFHASSNTVGVFLPVKFAMVVGIISNLETVFFDITAIVVTVVTGAERLFRTEEMQVQG